MDQSDPQAVDQDNSRASWLPTLIGFGISAVFSVLTFDGVDFSRMLVALRTADPIPLVLAVPVQAICILAAAVRTKELLRPLGEYSVKQTLRAFLAFFVANNLFPFRLGELVRIDYLARVGGKSHAACLAVVGVERLLDLALLCVLFFTVLPFSSGRLGVGSSIVGASGLIVLSFLVIVWFAREEDAVVHFARRLVAPFGEGVQSLTEKLLRGLAGGLGVVRSASTLARAQAFSLLYWVTPIIHMYLILSAFSLPLDLAAAAVVILFLSLGQLIPAAPSGVGTFHFICVWSLGLYGVDASEAASVAIVAHLVSTVPFTLIGIPFALPAVFAAWRRKRSA